MEIHYIIQGMNKNKVAVLAKVVTVVERYTRASNTKMVSPKLLPWPWLPL